MGIPLKAIVMAGSRSTQSTAVSTVAKNLDHGLTNTIAEKVKRDAKLSRAKTVPSRHPSALPYVLPLERQESIALLNLRRAGSVMTKKFREISLRGAKKHWVNARLKDQEDKFVTWNDMK